MASTHKSLRSSTADKRPTTSIADGQIALNTNAASPGLFFKDSAGTDIIKVGPVHVGTTAPNATPATGGSSGNSTGEVWLDTSLTPLGVKIWDGGWQNATPAGSTTIQGLLELATNAETQTGTDTARAVTPAGLQSKVSDSTSTTSSTTIASSTAVKSAYDLANAALPKTGGTITGALEIGTTGSLVFEGATANDYETTVAVTDPTADRTITLPDRSGTVITNADTGTVTSTMIADGTIVNADVNASAAIAGTKISPNFGAQTLVVDTNVLYVDATTNRVGIGTSSAGAKLSIEEKTYIEGGYIRFLDNASSPTGTAMWRPASDTLAFNTNSTERLRIDSSGHVGIGTSSPDDLLHLSGTNSAIGANFTLARNLIRIEDTDTTQASGQIIGGILFEGNDNDTSAAGLQAALTANTNSGTGGGQLRFYTAATSSTLNGSEDPRLLIDGSGRVGIGTANLSTYGGKLSIVDGAIDGETTLVLANNSQDQFARLGINSNEAQIAWDNADALVFGTATTSATAGLTSEFARIDSSGRLLVGTSNASSADPSKLEIYGNGITNGDGGGSQLLLRKNQFNAGSQTADMLRLRSGVGTQGQLSFGLLTNSGGQVFGFIDQVTGTGLQFQTGGTERMVIDSSGNVGIGTSSPGSYNSVANQLVVSDASNAGITINAGTTGSSNIFFADSGNNSQGQIRYFHSIDALSFGVNGSDAVRIDSSGRLGVGTSNPIHKVTIEENGTTANAELALNYTGATTSRTAMMRFQKNSTNFGYIAGATAMLTSGNADDLAIAPVSGKNLLFGIGSGEKARIDSSGNLGLGISSPSTIFHIQKDTSSGTVGVYPEIRLDNDDATGRTAVSFYDGATKQYDIFCYNGDGSLRFRNNTSEAVRLSSGGFFKASNTGSFIGAAGAYHELNTDQAGQWCILSRATNASYSSNLYGLNTIRSASSVFSFLKTYSGNLGDVEHYLRGDGNAYADGSWNGGGADYAEYFEWSDGNTAAEDRRGISVVLNGDKIRAAVVGEEPIGVISGNPSVVGDADIDRWKGKYLRDDFGTYIQEDYEVEDEDGNTVTQQRRKLNPDYNPDQEYTSREDRPEWDCVGLMGKLRIRKGQVTGARWIKMRDISDNVEEWLVR